MRLIDRLRRRHWRHAYEEVGSTSFGYHRVRCTVCGHEDLWW